MEIKKYTLEDAHDLLLSKRKICDPNPGFMLQLTCFEWALSLMPKSYVTNQIIKGPVFNEIQFDFANYEVLFCEDLETMYDGCIFIDRCHMLQFRPVITSNIIYNYCKGYCDEIYQLDILESLKQHSKPTTKPTPLRILIVSTNDNILVLAYWNLLYRSGMSYRLYWVTSPVQRYCLYIIFRPTRGGLKIKFRWYDESFKYFKQNASIELNNAFDVNSRTILYPYNTPRKKIIETQLARLKKYEEDGDKKFMGCHLKSHVKSIKAFINVICHYFIPEIQEYKIEILAKLDRQMTMCV